MKCAICGSDQEPVERLGVHVFDAHGLGVELRNVRFVKCPECEDEAVEIPHLEGLHSVLAEAIIVKDSRLVGAEIRFLRKYVGLSGADFAAVIGANRATVSRWENDKQNMTHGHERALRALASRRISIDDYHLFDALRGISLDAEAQPSPRSLEHSEANWKIAA